ncbi:MAG: MarR family transcriptional regulator [Saprospiraceae bacterium]|nr:MarR family transcriptional regulator [Saprospiraceae bacterium]
MHTTQILINLRKIIRSVNLESKRIEKEFGLSMPQLLCLNYLNTKPDIQASHKEIKDFLQLNASTVTGIITRLEKKDLVSRLPRQNDRRIGPITLTSRGVALTESSPDPLHMRLSNRMEKLSDQQLSELEQAFSLIIQFLNIEDLEAPPILAIENE